MVSARTRPHKQPAKKLVKAKMQTGIVREMCVADIVALCPGADRVFEAYGIYCAGCSMGGRESLLEATQIHGFEDGDIVELLDDLNVLFRKQPQRPQTLTVTETAAKALAKVLKNEGKTGSGLLVALDTEGNFCMEFRKEKLRDELSFSNVNVPSVKIFASPLTLGRIGGAAIDFREGRFKLDLPEAANPKS
jgi:Fe-S cluster assembly iron-binding protein IscA